MQKVHNDVRTLSAVEGATFQAGVVTLLLHKLTRIKHTTLSLE